MSPLKQSKNVAARMGGWSASHWKTATFGWLAFVIAAFAVGIAVPMQQLEQKDSAVGEAGKANKIIDDAFNLDRNGQGELVIVQSQTKTVDDPAFRAVITEELEVLSSFDKVDKLHSPLDAANAGQISADRHSALAARTPRPGSTSTRSSPPPPASRRPTRTSTSPRRVSRLARRSTR
jgi:RND superfamily putative drug exporter